MNGVNTIDRETLTVMQQRLTDRLQVAKTAAVTGAWLGVRIQGLNWLFSLADAGEIFDNAAPIKLPHTKSWLSGVTTLRGALYSVVDLPQFISSTHAKLMQHAREQSLSSESAKPVAADDRRMVALGASLELNAAFAVDGLLGIKHPASFVNVEHWSLPAPNYLGAIYTDALRQRWQEVNLRNLSQNQDFMNASI
jgi:chemotaxis signal transduction protein